MVRVLLFLGYVATIFLANWAIQAFGFAPVGFGLMAPAGVYFAGLAFTLRDLLQDRTDRLASVSAILAGSAVSMAISPQFGLASGVAFLFSELADFAVYTPLRKRGWLRAVFFSNVVGAAIDSAIFLYLAFGSIDFIVGQIVGKAWVTLLAVALLALWRKR